MSFYLGFNLLVYLKHLRLKFPNGEAITRMRLSFHSTIISPHINPEFILQTQQINSMTVSMKFKMPVTILAFAIAANLDYYQGLEGCI